jgi:polyphosphate kinase 2 (PPK2 family)
MESGSEVHQYLEAALSEYYFRDDDGLIRATPEAAELVDVEPGISEDDDGMRVRLTTLQADVLSAVPDADAESASVVAILHAYRDATGKDPTAGDVREALNALKRKGVVERVQRAVPTFRLTRPRDEIDVSTGGD